MADVYYLHIVITHAGEWINEGVLKDFTWNTVDACKDFIANSTDSIWQYVKHSVELTAVIRGDDVAYVCKPPGTDL